MYSNTDLNPQKPSDEDVARAQLQLRLIAAVRDADTGAIDACLDDGADIDHLDREQKAPIHYAIEGGNSGIVRHLVIRGADINLQGPNKSTPLHMCADRRNRDLARIFIRRGAKMTLRDSWGLTVPDRAAMLRHKDMATFLREEPSLQQANRTKYLYTRRHRPGL